jgi:osmoprotectant transport system permease protein
VAFRALANGDIDVYVDYSGTLWLNAMGRNDVFPRKIMLQELSHWLKSQYGILLLGPLGFENAYALAMRRSRADALGIHTIQDLAVKGSDFSLGTDLEFMNRPEWKNLRDAYSLSFRSQRSFSPTIMYQALTDDVVDVISAFSSDGRIKANDLVVLVDTMQVMPTYDAVILISPKLANDTNFIKSISPLIGGISIENMREANYQVDRRSDKRSPKEAARFLAGTLSVPSQPGSLSR